MISIRNLKASYGPMPVLFGINLDLDEGQTLALIGSNGAGKSTTFSVLCGLLRASEGTVRFAAHDLNVLSATQIVETGLIMVPEGRRLFPSLSVEENLLVGAHAGRKGPWTLQAIYELFPALTTFRDRPSGELSGGQQQLVAIGRALMANPLVLLCDELSLGLSPAAVDIVYSALEKVREQGLTTIIVEQDIARALSFSDRFACMRHGEIVLTGGSASADRAAISSAYFGTH
jgi:branched-chain amino acid transport system ATP-binding protein